MNCEPYIPDLIELLLRCDWPISAAQIADYLHLPGSGRESARRRARELVTEARERGHRICALPEGYWLARNDAEWAAYTEDRADGARCDFARLRRMREAAREAIGKQGLLFDGTSSRLDYARA